MGDIVRRLDALRETRHTGPLSLVTLIPYLIAVAVVEAIPIWVFPASLLLLMVLCVRYWRRSANRNRNKCIVLAVLVALGLGLRIHITPNGPWALRGHFRTALDPNNVVEYQHQLAGIEDHRHYWKLRDTNADDCNRVIEEFELEASEDAQLFDLEGAPSWWPKSVEGYSVFVGSDGHGGVRRIWVPKSGTTVYVFKFSE